MNICFEGLPNLEYWSINKSNDMITIYVQYWWWCPNQKMEENSMEFT